MWAAGAWVLAQLNWLAWAYQLEFLGRAVFVQVQLSSLLFFAAHVYAAVFLLRQYQPQKSFRWQLLSTSGRGMCQSADANKQTPQPRTLVHANKYD